MVWNKTAQRLALTLITTAMFSGCTVMMDRESPLNEVTKDSPTVLDVYRGTDYRNEATQVGS